MNMLEVNNHKFLFLAFIFLFASCLEKEEGCLDPNATNLDVTADENAGCTYPELQFSVNHVWGEESFRQNTGRPISNDDTLVVSRFECYISNVVLDGSPKLTVFDSIVLMDRNFIQDDLTILSLNALSFDIGHVNEFGIYDGLNFAVGFDEEWNDVDTLILSESESSHPWFESTMRQENDQRYVMNIKFDLIKGDTVTRELSLSERRLTSLAKNGSFTAVQATNAVLSIVIDYEQLLGGIDLRTASDAVILDSIWINLEQAIQVSE